MPEDHSSALAAGRPLNAHKLCCSRNALCLFRAWVVPTDKYVVEYYQAKWGSSALISMPKMKSYLLAEMPH